MKRTNTYFMLFLLCVSFGVLFTGCNSKNNRKDNGSAENVKTENSTPSPSPSAAENVQTADPEQEETKICFIGNSLIDYGIQSSYLEDIALSYGRRVAVDKIVWGGAYLNDYLKGTYMRKKEVKRRLKKADIVVFQDYGGWLRDATFYSIKKLKKWCKKDARLYYYMYENDNHEMESSDYERLKSIHIKFIPKGQMIEALYSMSYSYEELHVENDFHPNNLNGYLSALVMYGVIFDEKCSDFPKEWFLGEKAAELSHPIDIITEALHGNSEEEIWKEFMAICEKADVLIKKAKKL